MLWKLVIWLAPERDYTYFAGFMPLSEYEEDEIQKVKNLEEDNSIIFMSCSCASQSYLIDHCGINPLLSNIHFICRYEISLFQFLETWKMLCFNLSIQMRCWYCILHGIFFFFNLPRPYHFEKYTMYSRFLDQILNFNLKTPSRKHTIVKKKIMYSLGNLAPSLYTVHILIKFFLHLSLLLCLNEAFYCLLKSFS